MSSFDPRDRSTVLIHFYRAMVGRADIWRMRMDTTTNWAIGATAAVVSFSLGSAAVPHYAVFMAPLLTLCFLMLEARRLTFYHLFQQRVLLMEKEMIRPALHAGQAESDVGHAGTVAPGPDPLIAELDGHLGRTAPTMSLFKAAARRLRRVYVYLFAVQWLAWVLKLSTHPTPAASLAELVARAGVGPMPGGAWFAISIAGLTAALVVATVAGGVDRRAPVAVTSS